MGAGFGGTPAWGPEDTSGEFTELTSEDLADFLEVEAEPMQTGENDAEQLGTPEGSGAATASAPTTFTPSALTVETHPPRAMSAVLHESLVVGDFGEYTLDDGASRSPTSYRLKRLSRNPKP